MTECIKLNHWIALIGLMIIVIILLYIGYMLGKHKGDIR